MATTSDANESAATLTELTTRFERAGYTGQFAAVEAGEVMCFSCHKASPAADFTIDDISRTEGASDPDDMSAVAATACPLCKAKGTLVMNYGPASSPDDAEVLRLI